jgi:hypothetical protein
VNAPVHLEGDCLYFPAPPKLSGGLLVTAWLRQMAETEEKRGATRRAQEAREIADWLDRLRVWLKRENYEAAPVPRDA